MGHLHACCPEMEGTGVRVHRSKSCYGECDVDYHPVAGSPAPHGGPDIWHELMHFTSRKPFQTVDGKETWRFARATMDKNGNIVKTTISR